MTVSEREDQVSEQVAAPAPAPASEPVPVPGPGRRGWLSLLAVAVGVLVLASGCVAWWQAVNDEDLARAEDRDSALIAARSAIEVMNTLDHRDVEGGLAAWEAVTTGTLHDQLFQVDDEQRQLLADQSKVSVGEVIEAAVLDLGIDTATVIAAIEITVTDTSRPDAEATVKRNRFSADLVRVDGVWKLEQIGQVAVDLS